MNGTSLFSSRNCVGKRYSERIPRSLINRWVSLNSRHHGASLGGRLTRPVTMLNNADTITPDGTKCRLPRIKVELNSITNVLRHLSSNYHSDFSEHPAPARCYPALVVGVTRHTLPGRRGGGLPGRHYPALAGILTG